MSYRSTLLLLAFVVFAATLVYAKSIQEEDDINEMMDSTQSDNHGHQVYLPAHHYLNRYWGKRRGRGRGRSRSRSRSRSGSRGRSRSGSHDSKSRSRGRSHSSRSRSRSSSAGHYYR